MAVTIETEGRGVFAVHIVGGASVDAAGQGAIANPEGASVIILRGTLYVVSPSTAAADLDVGIAADAATLADDILSDVGIDGLNAGSVYNCYAMQNTAETEITAPALWTAGKYLTISAHDASAVGFEAYLYLEYVRL